MMRNRFNISRDVLLAIMGILLGGLASMVGLGIGYVLSQ
jgi:hypothetical protein